jgi:hypothetical protein
MWKGQFEVRSTYKMVCVCVCVCARARAIVVRSLVNSCVQVSPLKTQDKHSHFRGSCDIKAYHTLDVHDSVHRDTIMKITNKMHHID